MKFLGQFLRLLFWISVLTLVVASVMRDQFPSKSSILYELDRAPIQEEVTMDPFTVEADKTTYTISPLYTYDIVGLVVSEHRADTLFDYYHKLWGDSLNVKDLCVVWGTNALTGIYNDLSFKSGSWTCYVRSDDSETWRAFNKDGFSNNHLLSADPRVEKILTDVRRGDQVRIKGYLANYSHGGGFERSTSITRTDTGNGACETVYVSEIEILRQANPMWRSLHTLSFNILIVVTTLRIVLFFIHSGSRSRKQLEK